MSHLESNLDVGVATQEWYTFLEDLCNLKVTLFLNLAASNLKLDNFDGARRCCNASILFSNKPQLKLEDMGVEDDLNNVDIEVLQPVNEARVQFIVKALFRRGKCLLGLNLLSKSRSDLLLGLSLLRSAKIVNKDEMEDDLKACLDDVEKCISREKELSSIVENDNSDWKVNNTDHFSVEKMIQSFPFSIMVNGGFCMMRQAAWSQSVPDATVYIPLSLFATIADQISTELPKIDNKTKWRVEFEPHALTVKYYGNLIFYENLEHNIVPSQCLWMLEDHSKSSVQQAMVLYLHKATSLEWFPGCEWWDRVFPTDEPIDTLTCSIGTDVSQLPDNARQRAHKEHGLFEDLDPSAQRCALEHLQQSKQVRIFHFIQLHFIFMYTYTHTALYM